VNETDLPFSSEARRGDAMMVGDLYDPQQMVREKKAL